VPAAALSALAQGWTIKAGERSKVSSKDQKYLAAARSLEFVEPGMVLGLGTGSTAAIMVELLGERVSQGFWVSGIPTSEATAELARRCGIPLTDFDQIERVDLTIDGADETDGELRLIKGGGGALLREKIVASLSERMIVIADASKKVAQLGAFPLPVEVVPFAAPALRPRLAELRCEAVLRADRGGQPFVSDEGNLIIDCHFGAIAEPEALARELNAIPGVVEHGLFLGMAERVLLGGATGVEELVRSGT
jgi:ribose 5-phosphate isomerase A